MKSPREFLLLLVTVAASGLSSLFLGSDGYEQNNTSGRLHSYHDDTMADSEYHCNHESAIQIYRFSMIADHTLKARKCYRAFVLLDIIVSKISEECNFHFTNTTSIVPLLFPSFP